MGAFWELKCLQKFNEILDAFLEAKRELWQIFVGSAQRNARGPGEDYGGDKN